VAVGEAAGEAVAGLGVGLTDGVPDGGVLADWPGIVVSPAAVLPGLLDAVRTPDLELPPVSA
jgi:hypothetical protein